MPNDALQNGYLPVACDIVLDMKTVCSSARSNSAAVDPVGNGQRH
jgi:hypothetical protein